jgi:hypothetical protein
LSGRAYIALAGDVHDAAAVGPTLIVARISRKIMVDPVAVRDLSRKPSSPSS